MVQPDQQPQMPPAAHAAYEYPPTGPAPGEAEMMAQLARKLSAQPAIAAKTLLGIDLPLLASQVAAAHSYRHAYGSPAELPSNDSSTIAGVSPKVLSSTDHSVKPAGASLGPDAQSGKSVNLKRRKVNANRFRARPNKPPE